MFRVKCPQCDKELTLSQRKGLLFKSYIKCVHCGNSLKVKEKSSLLNAWFLGTILGVTMSLFLNADLPTIVVTVLLAVFFFQGFVDIFYSLEPDDEELHL